ncbi:hypothetical protein ACFWD2_08190, partial [Streptomyces anthocyanicus]
KSDIAAVAALSAQDQQVGELIAEAMDKVGAVGATSLTVAWEGALGEETYTRSGGGSLPPGLPTAGIGS